MNYKENLHIDIIDLAKCTLKHWKMITAGALLGAVVLGGYGYMKSGVAVNTETGEPNTGAAVSDYDSLKAALSDEDAVLAEDSARQYLNYAKEYERALEYGDDSIALKINSHKAPKMVTLYNLKEQPEQVGMVSDSSEGGLVAMSDVRNIECSYSWALIDDSVLEEIKNEAGIDADNTSIRELISVNITGRSILEVSVVGVDKEMCEAIMPILERKVDEYTPKLKENYDFEISKIDTNYTVEIDWRLDSLQKDYNGYMYSLRSNMNGIPSVLTPEQKSYYMALISNINAEVLAGSDGETEEVSDLIPNENAEAPKGETKIVRSFNKKFVVLGFIGGAFAVMGLYAALYVISGKLHTAENLRDAFELSIIGEVKGDNDKKVDVINSEIGIAASKIKASKLCMIGAAMDDNVSRLRETISKGVKGKNDIESCEVCNDVINSIADMETMSGSEAVVLVEKKNSSRYEDIAKELELCNKYEVKVLGAVILN